jgi:hypothetical protein
LGTNLTETEQKAELDIWIPQYSLGVEYQGEQHYHLLKNAFGRNSHAQICRDALKRELCRNAHIQLLPVPYWWDGKKESLQGIFAEMGVKINADSNYILYYMESRISSYAMSCATRNTPAEANSRM